MPLIRRVDPRRHDDLHAWWSAGRAGADGRPFEAWRPWSDVRAAESVRDPERERVLLLAEEDGTAVGAAQVQVDRRPEDPVAGVDVWVAPGSRRRGTGTRLLVAAEAEAVALGRRVARCEVFSPTLAADGVPGLAFAAARGYRIVHQEQTNVVEMDEFLHRASALAAEVAAHVGDHRIVTFESVPAEHLSAYGRMLSVLYSQVPTGELTLEDSPWDPARVRAWDAYQAAAGRRQVQGIALTPDGELVGVTGLVVPVAEASTARVGVTLVHPDHRGHRLGLALKLATHEALHAAHPECRRVVTSNAVQNDPMLAINTALGYTTRDYSHETERTLL